MTTKLSKLCAAIVMAAISCSGKSSTLKVGVISGKEEEVAQVAVRLAKERFGVDVELVVFSDYVTPNAALSDGSLDANAFQHRQYLDQQIRYWIVEVMLARLAAGSCERRDIVARQRAQ